MVPTQAILWGIAGISGAAALALHRAHPTDAASDSAGFPAPIRSALSAVIAGICLTLLTAYALFRFGVIWPAATAGAVYVTYRILLHRVPARYSRHNLIFAITTLICTVIILLGHPTPRNLP